MTLTKVLRDTQTILSQGSVYERLRRDPAVQVDPHISHAGLVYDKASADQLASVQREYIDIANRFGLPMLAMASSWRADRERVARSRFADRQVNGDQVQFLRRVIDSAVPTNAEQDAPPIFVAGVVGPRGNAFDPGEGLSRQEAETFHSFQVEGLTDAGPDALVAMTLPTIEEARGIGSLMAESGLPYLISFVIDSKGRVLDGTPLGEAMTRLDEKLSRPPTGYMVNCVHPIALGTALDQTHEPVRQRLIGIRANTSVLPPRELEGQEKLVGQEPQELAGHMAELRARYGLKILGGCCGTTTQHMEAIAQLLKTGNGVKP